MMILFHFQRPEKKAESGVGGKRLDEKSGFVNMGTIRIGAPPPQQQQQQPIVAQALPQMQMRPLGTMVAGGGLQPQQLINAVRPPVAANLGGVVSQLILGAGLQQQQQVGDLDALFSHCGRGKGEFAFRKRGI
jgi:hypothetical protein